MNATTTKLSLDYMRGLGYLVDVVERWLPNPQGGHQTKRDLFGILDLVGVRDGVTVGVQTTSKSNMSARAKKIAAEPATRALIDAGWLVVVHGWSQPGGKGTRYQMDEIVVALDPLPAVEVTGYPATVRTPFPNLLHQADQTHP